MKQMQFLTALLAMLFLSGVAVTAAQPATPPAPVPIAQEGEQEAESGAYEVPLDLSLMEQKARDMRLPGVSLADGVTQITGVAVSPLLGVSAVGAWKYFQTPEEHRHRLPWYCQPWAWGIGFAILGSILVKDIFGTVDPTLMKKPLDFAELYEDKASALLALLAFIPIITAAMAEANAIPLGSGTTMTAMSDSGLATMAPLTVTEVSWVKMVIYLPVMMACFFVVWLSGHAINVLIALSPFGMVDAVLKAGKVGLMLLIAGASYLHPLLGLLVCLPIIFLAVLLSGWAFRFMVFGSVFGWDLLLQRKADPAQLKDGVRAFTARRYASVPKRTYGRVTTNALGMHVFRHRPWLVLGERETALEEPLDGITDGVIHPSLTRTDARGLPLPAFLLPPRYRKVTQEIGRALGIQSFAESGLKRGLGNVRIWFSEVLVMSGGPLPAPAGAGAGNTMPPPMPRELPPSP